MLHIARVGLAYGVFESLRLQDLEGGDKSQIRI